MKKIISLTAVSLLTLGTNITLPEIVNGEELIISKKVIKKLPSVKSKPPEKLLQPNVNQGKNSTTLTLISNGVEPRIPLRFTPEVNTKEKIKMSLKMDVKMGLADGTFSGQGMQIPTLLFIIESNVTEIDTNGDIHFKFTVTDLDLEKSDSNSEELIKIMRSQLKKVVGLGGTFVVTETGKPKGGKIDIPKELQSELGFNSITEQLTKTLEQISAPIPTEPVGVGAKWTTSENVEASFIKVKQNTLYEIVSIKDGIITLKVVLDQKADPQKLQFPGMPKDFNFSIQKLDSTGSGDVVFSLKKMFPITSNLNINTDSAMQMMMRIKDPKNKNKNDKIEMNMNMKQVININLQSE